MRPLVSRALLAALFACTTAGVACGGAGAGTTLAAMTEMEQVRTAPGAREGAALAPQEFQKAEEQRALAQKAHAAGDETAAALYADRAVAAYNHSLVLARRALAEKDRDDATMKRDQANAELQTLASSRADMERDADGLEKQVEVAREMLLPAPSGPADPQREAARRVAARALGMQARLLCGSARLLAATLPGMAEADAALAALDKKLDAQTAPAPIDDAARARAECLHLLTVARRSDAAAGDAGPLAGGSDADALLSELSASGGWNPSRDERGVVVTLRDVFQGTSLTADTQKKIADLARVAAAHPAFAVQIVVHDAVAPSVEGATEDQTRADTLVKALVAGGANAAETKGETAGARAPLVDPTDAKDRERNARVEIVFVAPTNG